MAPEATNGAPEFSVFFQYTVLLHLLLHMPIYACIHDQEPSLLLLAPSFLFSYSS